MFLTMLLIDFFHEDWSARCCELRGQGEPFMVLTGDYRPLPVLATGLEVGAEVILGGGWNITRDNPCDPVDRWLARLDESVEFEIRYGGVTPPMAGVGAYNLVLPRGWRFENVQIDNPNYIDSPYMVARDDEGDREAVMLHFQGANTRFNLTIRAVRGSGYAGARGLDVPVDPRRIIEPSAVDAGTQSVLEAPSTDSKLTIASPANALPPEPSPETWESADAVTNFEYDVFILFNASDIEVARRIQSELVRSDYTVWWDEGQLVAHAALDEISSIITKCRYIVVVLSTAFVDSPIARDELLSNLVERIERVGGTVIPVLYEMCPIPSALELKEFSDFITSPNRGNGQLLTMLRVLEGKLPPRPPGTTLQDAVNRLIGSVNDAPELYVAMDLGGTKAYISIMTRDGDRLFDRKFTTQSHGDASALLGFLVTSIDDSIHGLHKTTGIDLDRIRQQKISAYGIAFAGPTDSPAGVVRDASNFTIKNFPLASRLKRHLGKPVYIGNDANLGVLGETWKGVARRHRNVIGIIIGTGIGGGIVINRQVYNGSTSAAGEIGHMVVDPDPNPDTAVRCGCGQLGCFEALASRKAIAEKLSRRKKERYPSDVRWEERNLGSAELADYYAAGDVDAVEIVTEAARIWGKAVRTLLNTLNPDMVFFGGGFVRQLGDKVGESFLSPVIDEAKGCMNSVYELEGSRVPIVLGSLENPMLAGACLLAIRRSKGRDTTEDIIGTISASLGEDEVKALESIYNYDPQLTRISRDPLGDFSERKLRELRNRGLVATVDSLSFKDAGFVRITDLGSAVIEYVIASRSAG